MKVEEIKDEKIWEDFVRNWQPNNFLTSWQWGQFNEVMGEKIFRLALFKHKSLIGVCLAIKMQARRGTFILCPAGPLLADYNKKNLEFFVGELKKLAKEEKAKFIRIRPLVPAGEVKTIIEGLGAKPSPTHVHAQVSWLLDISKAEEELLAGMRKTTRYLVKQAVKLGVEIEEESDINGVKILEKLQVETSRRHSFVPFSNEYLEKEFEVFAKEKEVKILLAKKGDQVLSAAMIIFYGDCAFYHHGASTQSKIPASYLLQWEAIKAAKRAGKKYYNFWGIAPTPSPNHPWAGLTLFKKGFGGFRLEYTKPYDLPVSNLYPVIYWFEKLRSARRGLNV